jgi:hypothetical protein
MVNPDCTGSIVINLNVPVPVSSTGVIKNKFVISNGGRHNHQVVSEFTPPGSTTGPVPAQGIVDAAMTSRRSSGSRRAERRRADQIAEHHRQLLAFGLGWR